MWRRVPYFWWAFSIDRWKRPLIECFIRHSWGLSQSSCKSIDTCERLTREARAQNGPGNLARGWKYILYKTCANAHKKLSARASKSAPCPVLFAVYQETYDTATEEDEHFVCCSRRPPVDYERTAIEPRSSVSRHSSDSVILWVRRISSLGFPASQSAFEWGFPMILKTQVFSMSWYSLQVHCEFMH